MFVKILFLILSLALILILFVPLKGVYYHRDLLNEENQFIEGEKPLEFSVSENNRVLNQGDLPYIIVKNTDSAPGYFRIRLWSVSESDKGYRNYINSSEYVSELVGEHAELYIDPNAVISFDDFIDRLYPAYKFEWTVWLLPMQDITVSYPKIDDESAYVDDMWDWGYNVNSLSTGKSLKFQPMPKMVYTYVPLVTYWSGSNWDNWIGRSIFYSFLAFIVMFILYKLLNRYLT